MSKALRIVGVVASVAAIVTGNPIFAAVAMAANTAATMTAKKPPVQGSPSNVLIASNAPMPYVIGRTYTGGNLVHEVGYGPTSDDVKNPLKAMVFIWSGGGPAESIEGFYTDFTLTSFSGGNAVGYYNNYLRLTTQLGNCPEGAALNIGSTPIPDWGSAHKLSGYAAGMVVMSYSKSGKRFGSGTPQFGAVLRGPKAYDPRQDSTYPGGSGACRPLNEATYVGGATSENPSCAAVTYAMGRYQNGGKKVFGCGFRPTSIDWPAWVEFANVCDANGWKAGGVIFEPGSRWDNLKRICAAGGGEPIFVGAKLSVRFNAPKVALDTISLADLADGEIQIPAMKSWRDRKNGLIPKYRSEAHKWEYVQSDLVTVPEYVTQDRGEEKHEERQIDLCQNKNQGAQLCAYELVNGREMGPIVVHLKPRFIEYQVGETLEIGEDLEDETGLPGGMLVNIIGRSVDPQTAIITLTLESETTAKHAYALGQTGTAPPTPALIDPEAADDMALRNQNRQVHVEVTPTITFAADFEGTVNPDFLPAYIYPRVTLSGQTVKTDDEVHYSITCSGVTATVDDADGSPTKGDVEITALTANAGYVDLTVTVDGVSLPAKRTNIRKEIGLPSALGGPGAKIATDNAFGGVSTTTYGQISDTARVTLGAAESLYGTAPLDYIPANGSSEITRTATLVWQYSTAGAGVWTDFGAGISGSPSRSADAGEPETGHVDCNQSKSGLTAGDYDVRLMAKLDGSGRTVNFTGTATIQAKA